MSQDTLKVKDVEFSASHICYFLWEDNVQDQKTCLPNEQVKRVILQNGRVFRFAEMNKFKPNYSNQRTLAIKTDLPAYFFACTSLSIEKSLKPRTSIELGVGIIGWGFNRELFYNHSGFFLRIGPKFFIKTKNPYKYQPNFHRLKGWYMRPEFTYHLYSVDEKIIDNSNYYYNYQTGEYTYRITITEGRYQKAGGGGVFNFGYQGVLKGCFVYDLFIGYGFGFGSNKTLHENTTTNYSSYQQEVYDYTDDPWGTGFILMHDQYINPMGQLGFKIGYLINSKQIRKD